IAAIVAGKLLGRPVILGSQNLGSLSCRNWDPLLASGNLDPRGWLATLLKWPVRKTYASASALVGVCREMEVEALQCGVASEKIHYLPNTVDLNRFRPPQPQEGHRIRLEEGWPKDRIICIYVGRLGTEKGILDLLDAWRSVEDHRAILMVVGPDMPGHTMDCGPAARNFVTEHKMEDRVIFYGPSENIPRLLRAADIFIQPSHYEAFPHTVIEAMATGLPVIATQVGGMKDFLADHVNALLCEPISPNELARQIRRLIDDTTLRDQLGANGRATVERDFDEKVVFEKFSRLFSETS